MAWDSGGATIAIKRGISDRGSNMARPGFCIWNKCRAYGVHGSLDPTAKIGYTLRSPPVYDGRDLWLVKLGVHDTTRHAIKEQRLGGVLEEDKTCGAQQ